jgi:hypothetical protein
MSDRTVEVVGIGGLDHEAAVRTNVSKGAAHNTTRPTTRTRQKTWAVTHSFSFALAQVIGWARAARSSCA